MYCDAIATPWGPGLCIIHFYHFFFFFFFFFLSLQMNEILQFISLQMNEILKVELQLISPQCALDVSIIVGNPEVHPIISSELKHVTLQVLDFITVS